MEHIVNIECSYSDDKVSIIYVNKEGKKMIKLDDFKPFVWAKNSVAVRMFEGDREELKKRMIEYGISVKALQTNNGDKEVDERLSNGYKYLFYAKKPMSFQQFLMFFQMAKTPIYDNKKKKDVKEINISNKEFLSVSPVEQYMIYSGKRFFKGYDNYDDYSNNWLNDCEFDSIIYIDTTNELIYNNPLSSYFSICALEDGEFFFNQSGTGIDSNSVYASPLYISIDNATSWEPLECTEKINVKKGDILQMKAIMPSHKDAGVMNINTTFKFYALGNVLSLIYGDDFISNNNIEDYKVCFGNLFANSKIVSAKHLQLPSLNLSIGCYWGMFQFCEELEDSPKLIAKDLKGRCYEYMYCNCSKLDDITMLGKTINGEAINDTNVGQSFSSFSYNCAQNGIFTKDKDVTLPFIPQGWSVINA